MTDEQHAKRQLCRLALLRDAEAYHKRERSAANWKDRALDERELAEDCYDGDQPTFAREVDAVCRLTWGL